MSIAQSLTPIETTSVTDRVYQSLYMAIVTLELKPGSKVSEIEIAKSLEVSRQPVRDSFYRLSKLGFLSIRPQRATTISKISVQDLLDAVFVRTALEVECLRAAIKRATDADIERLEALLEKQRLAVDENELLMFHGLDNQFHQMLCEIAGHSSAWTLIRDQKVHMERVRYLALEGSARIAYTEHEVLLKYIKARDVARAESELRSHLTRIFQVLEVVRVSHSEYFENTEV